MKKVAIMFCFIFLTVFQGYSSAEYEETITEICIIISYPESDGGDGSCTSYEDSAEGFLTAVEENDPETPRYKVSRGYCNLACLDLELIAPE